MRKFLLLSVALPVLSVANAAMAQVEISDAQTDPIDTQTINGGSASDIVLVAAGSVLVPANQVAITLNSDNTITNRGTIGSNDANDTTGILVSGTIAGGITNSASISLLEDFTGTDTDKDGDLDGDFAEGSGRIGILVEGGAVFTGDITNERAGSIRIEGNDSTAVSIAGTMIGDLDNQGTIRAGGTQATGILVAGTLTGDLINAGAITTQGDGATGIRITGNVDGKITNTATISSTGYRALQRANATVREKLDADDLLQGGSALAVGGNVTGGIINNSVTNADDQTIRGTLRSSGSAPALLVAGSLDGVDTGDTLIGMVGLAADDENFGIINRGAINANGVNNGFSATGIRIEGTQIGVNLRRASIAGGILNSGGITATAFEANASGISVGEGGDVPIIDLRGNVATNALSQTGHRAAAIIIEAGATVNEVRINSVVQSLYTGTGIGGFAAGIVDESGTVDLLINNGRILTTFNELISSGETADPTDTTRRKVAIDLSANAGGVLIQQAKLADADPDDDITPLTPEINGDILLGSGNDRLELTGGRISGDVVFGDGDDLLLIDNGAELAGALYDSDGVLSLDVRDGLLALGADTTLSLTTAAFGPAARLQLTIDPGATGGIQSATFNASGAVTFADGARIAPILSGLIGDGGTFDLLSAGTFTFANTFAEMLDAGALPYLYNINLDQDTTSGNLFVELNRRTAAELGMSAHQATVYEAWFQAVSTNTDAAVGAGFAGLSNADDFFAAYDQILPEFGAAALQFTLANTDGTTGAIGNRLDALRRGYGDGGGVWIQEIGYYMDRNKSSIDQPYNGFGLGLAAGIDRPMFGFDAMGLSLSGFSNQIEQKTGFDTPLSSVSVQLGGYAGRRFGKFDFVTSGGIGLDRFDSARKLQLGTVVRTAEANWLAYHITSTSRLSRDFNIGKWVISPSFALDYLRLTEEGYKETGGGAGLDLALDSRVSENISATAAFTLGRRFGGEQSWWAPRLRLGLRNDLKGNSAITTARFSGFSNRFSLTPQLLPKTAILVGFSLTAGSRYTSFGLDFDTDIREGFARHTGKVVIRFVF